METLLERVKRHEGLRLFPYRCSAGHLTIGYGHKLVGIEYDRFKDGIDLAEAEEMLLKDLTEAERMAKHVMMSTWNKLPCLVQEVVIEMVFQLGIARFLKFRKFIAALDIQDYNKAADEMLDSLWHKQTLHRCEEEADLMRSAA